MSEARTQTIQIDGRTYQYDYDHDIYFRVYNQEPETSRERWTKIAVAVALLTALVVLAPYYHNL